MRLIVTNKANEKTRFIVTNKANEKTRLIGFTYFFKTTSELSAAIFGF